MSTRQINTVALHLGVPDPQSVCPAGFLDLGHAAMQSSLPQGFLLPRSLVPPPPPRERRAAAFCGVQACLPQSHQFSSPIFVNLSPTNTPSSDPAVLCCFFQVKDTLTSAPASALQRSTGSARIRLEPNSNKPPARTPRAEQAQSSCVFEDDRILRIIHDT